MAQPPTPPGEKPSDKPADAQADLAKARPGEVVDLSAKFAAMGISVFAFKKPTPRDN